MTTEPENKSTGPIDLDRVLASKNPRLAKLVPGFVKNYLKRIVHQEELNVFLTTYGHLKDAELVKAFLDHFRIMYRVSGENNVPAEGRFIFVSNHPLGGLDGVVFIQVVSEMFPDVKFPVNDILTNIENLSGIFLPVNKHGKQDREAAKRIEEAYASGSQILYFPAGLCSRKRNGVIRDLEWHKSFILKAVQHKRDIIPVYFSGRNSDFFYNLANIRKMLGLKANIEMIYLPDEMFRNKEKEIHLVFGKPVPWHTFDKTRTPSQWADHIKSESYRLGLGEK
jgi:putative hemolysin